MLVKPAPVARSEVSKPQLLLQLPVFPFDDPVCLDTLPRVEATDRATVQEDQGYDARHFVKELPEINISPRVAPDEHPTDGSAIDGRTRHDSRYGIRQEKQKSIEESSAG